MRTYVLIFLTFVEKESNYQTDFVKRSSFIEYTSYLGLFFKHCIYIPFRYAYASLLLIVITASLIFLTVLKIILEHLFFNILRVLTLSKI